MSSTAEGRRETRSGANVPLTLARKIETIEAEAWADFFRAAPARLVQAWGLELQVEGGVAATLARDLDVLALNRVIGLGLHTPATEAGLGAWLEPYERAQPARYAVQTGPLAAPPALTGWLKDRGFQHHNNWVKLYGRPPLDSLPRIPEHLRVSRIFHQDAAAFGEIVAAAFGWPPLLADWVAATVARRGWRHYLAFDRDVPIATGAIYARDDLAWLDFAATLPAHRGRGAQTALLAHRIREAEGQGARWLSAEAAEDRPDRPSPSLHNMLRLGLREAYRRPNYVRRRRPR